MNIAAGYTPNGAGGFTGLDPAQFDQQSKKLICDSLNERETMNTRPQQLTARPIEQCEVTRGGNYMNANEDRFDSSILSSLASNPYNININPIRDVPPVCKN